MPCPRTTPVWESPVAPPRVAAPPLAARLTLVEDLREGRKAGSRTKGSLPAPRPWDDQGSWLGAGTGQVARWSRGSRRARDRGPLGGPWKPSSKLCCFLELGEGGGGGRYRGHHGVDPVTPDKQAPRREAQLCGLFAGCGLPPLCCVRTLRQLPPARAHHSRNRICSVGLSGVVPAAPSQVLTLSPVAKPPGT